MFYKKDKFWRLSEVAHVSQIRLLLQKLSFFFLLWVIVISNKKKMKPAVTGASHPSTPEAEARGWKAETDLCCISYFTTERQGCKNNLDEITQCHKYYFENFSFAKPQLIIDTFYQDKNGNIIKYLVCSCNFILLPAHFSWWVFCLSLCTRKCLLLPTLNFERLPNKQ